MSYKLHSLKTSESQPFQINYKPTVDTSISFKGEHSRAKQSMKDECDINNIMSRYNKTGQLPGLIKREPQYGDFSDPITFQEACETVKRAEEQFAALPARTRERFGNDPQRFLAFTQDPQNIPEMETLGLFSESALQRIKTQREEARLKEAEASARATTPTPKKKSPGTSVPDDGQA